MSTQEIPARERQALEEVGVTDVSQLSAWLGIFAFLITVFGVPLCEPIAGRLGEAQQGPDDVVTSSSLVIFRDLGSRMSSIVGTLREDGIVATNRALQVAMDEFEERLEEESFLRRWLLPGVQWRLAATVGLGNEQVYVGRDGWLFFRSDLDHVTGPGFLDPEVMERRRRGGAVWTQSPEPDPLIALEDLHRQLAERGIRLIVVPTPVKPTVEPERFTRRAESVDVPLQNPSFDALVARLEEAGIDVFDPAPLLLARRLETSADSYLQMDTHWTPPAVDETARALATMIESIVPLSSRDSGLYRRREVAVQGSGDIAGMLTLPPGQDWIHPQTISAQMVSDRGGKRWRSSRGSEILLLGDSFSNVFSDPTLGWGAGAGLGEQLSYHLQRPLDKVAVNAGGALQGRQQLQRELSAGVDRLASKKVVVYQFATRELSQGDWRMVELRE